MTTSEANKLLNVRTLLVLFLLVVLVWLAVSKGWALSRPGSGAHVAHYPESDCGNNFMKVVLLPNGDECFVHANSAATVESEMQKQDPLIFDESYDYVDAARWDSALMNALRALGW